MKDFELISELESRGYTVLSESDLQSGLDDITDSKLCLELESRGFTIINEAVEDDIRDFLRDLPEDDVLISELSRRGYDYISDSADEVIEQLVPDYLPEMFDIVNDHGYFVIDVDDKAVATFRKNDCKGLIEDIVKRRGWNYLHEVLISC